MAALIAATGITLDTLQITQIDFKWWTLVAFVVFCIFVVSIIVDLNNKNRELENKKPSISVVPELLQDLWCLEVTNNGEKAVFSATVIFVPKLPNTIEERYDALWGKTMTDKTELMNGQGDVIKIASTIYKDDMEYFVMSGYDAVKKAPCLIRSIEYKQFINTGMKIQVIISSSPKFKDGEPFIRTYDIRSHYITPSKHQLKKLDSIPYKFVFGDDDVDANN